MLRVGLEDLGEFITSVCFAFMQSKLSRSGSLFVLHHSAPDFGS
jgi:hypothetical protein